MLYGARRPRMWLAAIVTLLALAFVVAAQLFRVRTTGTPLGSSVRAGPVIATLIVQQEPYIPSLHHDPSTDRFTLALLLHDARDPDVRRILTLARERPAAVLGLSRLRGVVGRRILFEVPEDGAYDLDQDRVLAADELNSDPTLARFMRTFSMADLASGEDALLRMQCSAGFVDGTRFLAVLSRAEADAAYKPGLAVPRDPVAERGSEPRHLLLGQAGRDGTRRPLVSLAPLGEEDFHDASFMRAERDGDALRLGPDGGFLMLYRKATHRAGTLMLARVAADGRIGWRIDTGIQVLTDILPDPQTPALVGTRPGAAGTVPEPVLVVVDAGDGIQRAHSLLTGARP